MTVAAADALGAAGVESTLGFADEPVLTLRDRLTLALRYLASWSSAVKSSLNPIDPAGVTGGASVLDVAVWLGRIDNMRAALLQLLAAMPPDSVFAGVDTAAAYNNASATFAQMYRELSLSMASLPSRGLLDQAADLGTAVFQAPAAAITGIAEQLSNGIARALGGTAAAIFSALWPWLLAAGGAAGVWYFRAPIVRLLAKGTK